MFAIDLASNSAYMVSARTPDFEADQLRRQGGQTCHVVPGEARFQRDGLSLKVPKVTEPFTKLPVRVLRLCLGSQAQEPDPG